MIENKFGTALVAAIFTSSTFASGHEEVPLDNDIAYNTPGPTVSECSELAQGNSTGIDGDVAGELLARTEACMAAGMM